MRQGYLSDYFIGAAAKTLKDTEVNPKVSRGHEFQGVTAFRQFLGPAESKVQTAVSYIWLTDDESPVRLDLTGTWYDGRRKVTHREPEYRLYYPTKAEDVVYRARAGDSLFLCKPKTGPVLAIMCPHGSSIEQQLTWLFGLQPTLDDSLSDFRESSGKSLDFTARYVLDLIGIEVIATNEEWLERLVNKFGEKFPGTREFSEFARQAVGTDASPLDDPDRCLTHWMEMEERLFMTLERHIVSQRLSEGFVVDGQPDVDGFVSFSLGVQNRRKSRAGWAFGNHVEALLLANDLVFKREGTTEKRNGPDFLFPGDEAYHDPDFDPLRLTMLAAKTSCKDRWRQVLAEADRIERKHLLTLEPGISQAQTDEMSRARLQLVLPRSLHDTYGVAQRSDLMNVRQFVELVKARQ